jgi:hypothetical protein
MSIETENKRTTTRKILTLMLLASQLSGCNAGTYVGGCPVGYVPKPEGYHGPGIAVVGTFTTAECVTKDAAAAYSARTTPAGQ